MVCFGHAVPGYALVFEQLPPAARVVDDALELLRCEVVSAQNEQDPTAESSQSLLHSVREWRFAGVRLAHSPPHATVSPGIDGQSADRPPPLRNLELDAGPLAENRSIAQRMSPPTRSNARPPQLLSPTRR